MNKSSNLFLGGIFVAGMATTYLLRQMKVLSAESFASEMFNTRVGTNPAGSPIPSGYGLMTNAPTGYNGPTAQIYPGFVGKQKGKWMVKYTGNKKGTRDATRAGAIDLALDDATGYWTDTHHLVSITSCPSCADCDSCCPACPPVVKCNSCCPKQTTKGGSPTTIATRKWWRW